MWIIGIFILNIIAKMPKKLSQLELINQFNEIHNGYYNYDAVVYNEINIKNNYATSMISLYIGFRVMIIYKQN